MSLRECCSQTISPCVYRQISALPEYLTGGRDGVSAFAQISQGTDPGRGTIGLRLNYSMGALATIVLYKMPGECILFLNCLICI